MEISPSHKSFSKLLNKDNYHSQMRKRKSLQSPKAKFIQGGKRTMGELRGMQPAKLIFVQDPLNLSSLCLANESSLSPKNDDKPEECCVVSPPSVNCKDPLHLNDVVTDSVVTKHPKKRKKRKRRSTVSEDDELNHLESVMPPSEKKILIASEDDTCFTNNYTSNHQFVFQKPSFHKRKFVKEKHFKRKNEIFRFGNFDNYYGLKNNDLNELLHDKTRLFEKKWFTNKNCLHVGCNSAYLTTWVAKYFEPSHILGIDIDEKLIKSSKRTVDKFIEKTPKKFPSSFSSIYGSINRKLNVDTIAEVDIHSFPNNISFKQENYIESVNSTDIRPLYDVILCLNICKWIQLNFGDEGLKLMFRKMFLQLKPGGCLFLEFHHFSSYKKHRNYTRETLKHYNNIQIMPTDFIRMLLSSDIGFSQSTCLGYNRWLTGGDRALYLLKKSGHCDDGDSNTTTTTFHQSSS